MNYFNLMREMKAEYESCTVSDYGDGWSCMVFKDTGEFVRVIRPTPEEAIRCAYLELNPLPRSGAI